MASRSNSKNEMVSIHLKYLLKEKMKEKRMSARE